MIKSITKFSLALAALGMVFSILTTDANAALIKFHANLNSDNILGTNNGVSDATGIASLIIDTDTGLYDITLDIIGINLADSTFAGFPFAFNDPNLGPIHIHLAPKTANGSIVFPFPDEAFYSETVDGYSLNVVGGAFDLSLVPYLFNHNLYLNVHTLNFGGGEIRGQLVPEPGMIALFGAGLLGIALYRRRRSS